MNPASIAAAYITASVYKPSIAARLLRSLSHRICEGERPRETAEGLGPPGTSAAASAAFESPTSAATTPSSGEGAAGSSCLIKSVIDNYSSRIRGSTIASKTSAMRFPATSINTSITTEAITIGSSLLESASKINVPKPGQPNTYSVSSAPASKVASENPNIVIN